MCKNYKNILIQYYKILSLHYKKSVTNHIIIIIETVKIARFWSEHRTLSPSSSLQTNVG